MALRLLHTADWHLGMRFPSFADEDQLTLMRARMDVLDNVFGAARAAQVDAVLCAGDLFDDPLPEDAWWQGLLDKLRAHDSATCPVILLPGNHDPLIEHSVWDRSHAFRRGLPEGVHVVDRDDFELAIGRDAVLVAAPCRTHAGQSGLWRCLPAREPSDTRTRIGMIHGQTTDIDGFQEAFPIPERIGDHLGLDYLAIGDTHAFREVWPQARCPVVYPSAPEPTKFGEVDAGFVAQVVVPSGQRAIVRRERVGRWRWVERTVRSLDELAALAGESDWTNVVMRLHVAFEASVAEFERATALLRELGGTEATHGRVGVFQLDREQLRLRTADLHAAFEGLPEELQEVVSRLRATSEGEGDDAEASRRAIYHLYRVVQQESL